MRMTGLNITIIIPAAGKSSRMGKDKLLITLHGETLLSKAVRVSLESKASEVVVVLREDQQKRIHNIKGRPVKIAYSKERANLMSNSIKAGLDAVNHHSLGVLIYLPDMPLIETIDLNRLISAYSKGSVVQACDENNNLGHPVLICRELIPSSFGFSGDRGLRSIIARNTQRHKLIPLPGNKSLLDIDTPQEWSQFIGAGEGT